MFPEVINIPVVTQRLFPTIQAVQKTIDIHRLLVDNIIDVPVVWDVQVSQVPFSLASYG